MSYLDNLENSLKALESQQERDPNEQKKRQEERSRRLAVGPWAEKLKTSPYVQALMGEATRAGFQQRAKCHITWLDNTLRLDLKEKRLELRPQSDGVVAVFCENGSEETSKPVDLEGDAGSLVKEWLAAS